MIKGKKDSYDIIGEAVTEFWNKTYAMDVVAFFRQKYEHEDDTRWEFHQELVESHSCDPADGMTFLNDFCEGETDVKDIKIVALEDILDFYVEQKGLRKHGTR